MTRRLTLLSLSLLLCCFSSAGQVNYVRVFIESIFGPSRVTLERRALETKNAMPGIASADTIRDGTLSKYVWEPYNTVAAIDTPENISDNIETDVRFLSDPVCSGRAMGTLGYSIAANYIFRRFRECGLEPSVAAFKANGKTGHNIIGEHRVKYANKWIIVISRLDGPGDHDGYRFPGADANASGIAAMLAIADRLNQSIVARNTMFIALDGHFEGLAGARALWDYLAARGIGPMEISTVVNIDEIGSDSVPPVKGYNEYLIALGGERYRKKMWDCNGGIRLQLHFDYYGSEDFTRIFYRKASDHRVFLDNGVSNCVMFTSGITMDTNRPTDIPGKLNYPLIEKRAEFISRWIKTL